MHLARDERRNTYVDYSFSLLVYEHFMMCTILWKILAFCFLSLSQLFLNEERTEETRISNWIALSLNTCCCTLFFHTETRNFPIRWVCFSYQGENRLNFSPFSCWLFLWQMDFNRYQMKCPVKIICFVVK